MLYVIATASVKPEKREDFKRGAAVCIAETRKEDGCLLYDLHESVTDPTRFVFVEQWANAPPRRPRSRSSRRATSRRFKLAACLSLRKVLSLRRYFPGGFT